MPRKQRLTAVGVARIKHTGTTLGPQRHFDGDGSGLALEIAPGGSKAWVQCITVRGRRRTIGLGSLRLVGLKKAREKARQNQRAVRDGRDPIAEHRRWRGIPDFRTLAREVIKVQTMEHTSPKSTAQWKSSLAAYAYPHIGRLGVDAITARDVRNCVGPIWETKRETAGRVLQRISKVMKWAIAEGHRVDNPALAARAMLPKRRAPVRHHRALPWAEVPGAVQTIRNTGAWFGTKLAFEFLVLTAARSGEVRGATWEEIDLDQRLWTVPAERMKALAEHRVPLADRCLEILADARRITDPPMTLAHKGCQLVFPSLRGKTISDSTISKLCRENGIAAVPHGFRSSFRDWGTECADARRDTMEAALAHTIPNRVERAYARSDHLDKRRELMARWAEHVVTGAEGRT